MFPFPLSELASFCDCHERTAEPKANCKNLGLEPCPGCRGKTGCELATAKRPLSEVKTAGLSPPRKQQAQRKHVAPARANGLRAHFLSAAIAMHVIACAAAVGGVAVAASRHPIEAGTESFLQREAQRKAIDRESRLIRAELELSELARYVRRIFCFPFPA